MRIFQYPMNIDGLNLIKEEDFEIFLCYVNILLFPFVLSLSLYIVDIFNKISLLAFVFTFEILLIILIFIDFKKYFKKTVLLIIKIKKIQIFFYFVQISLLSIFYLINHGLFIVSDAYFEQARAYYYIIFGGDKPNLFIMEIYSQRKFYFRPLFPLLCSFIGFFFHFFFSIETSIIVSGFLINFLSVIGIILLFRKRIKNDESLNIVDYRYWLLTLLSTPTLIVFMVKFSTDLFFTLLCVESMLLLLSYKETKSFKYLIYYLISVIISILIRELGVFLFFLLTPLIFKSKKKVLLFNILGFLIGLILQFILFKEKLRSSRGLWYLFYQNIVPFSNPNFDINFVDNWVALLLKNLFGFNVLKAIFFAYLWSLGSFSIIVLLFFINLTNLWKKRNFIYIKNENFKLISSFFFLYSIFIWIMMGNYISERYFLPNSLILIINFSKSNIKKTHLRFIIVLNLLMILMRLLYIFFI